MNLVPRSLRARTLLLILVAIIACEAITFGVFARFRYDFLEQRGREVVGSYVSLVRTALQRSPPEEVARHLIGNTGMQIRLVKDPPVPALRTFDPSLVADERNNASGPQQGSNQNITNLSDPKDNGVFSSDLVRSLSRRYGFGTVRHTMPPNEILWIRMHKDEWWLMIPPQGFQAPIPWNFIFSILAGILLIVALVSLYVLQLSRPLRALAQAAENFALGQRPQLPLAGPDEVRAVTSQFNSMAERLADHDAERRVMLAGLPHDLRAPLTRAKLRLALMDSPEEAETKRGFERDFNEVERIANQFVAYLRGLDNDQSKFEPTNIHSLIMERVEAWHGAGQDVVVQRVDLFSFAADRMAIDRAIDNLISNALTHGAAPVRVRGLRTADGYRIEVDDCGPGIPPDMREQALKPFARLDAARSDSGHCGLGLAVVQNVTKLHGGRIELHEAPGGGLRAVLIFPLTVQATAARSTATSPATTPSSPSGDLITPGTGHQAARG